MNNQPTLLILAAGMGSRYGGLKQIDPVGPHDERILDYSLYDAIRAGFQKIVFVIRRSFEEAVRNAIGSKLERIVETVYAYQELDSCLNGFPLPSDRQKPWGTGHAILVAQDIINQPFAVINADDYYGPNAYRIMKRHLDLTAKNLNSEYAMVGYVLHNTLSEHGNVSRGVCQYNSDLYLSEIVERTGLSVQGGRIVFTNEEGMEQALTGDEIVSMNLWGFTPDIFGHLQRQFALFLRKEGHKQKSEFYIPSVVNNLVQSGQKRVRILQTTDRWFGVTYQEDRRFVQSSIRKLIQEKVYPENLWKDLFGQF